MSKTTTCLTLKKAERRCTSMANKKATKKSSKKKGSTSKKC